MSELRVPTVTLSARVICTDGREFSGSIFVPASSSLHDGPMRAAELMNAGGEFFPFLPDEAGGPVILNKREVLVVSVASEAEQPVVEGVDIDRRVAVEFCGRTIEGHLHIDMPPHHSRVLDYLNRADSFLALHAGERVHLVQKRNITRVLEVREG